MSIDKRNKDEKVSNYPLRQKAHCAVYGCKELAKIAIGKRRYDISSTYLCEEHGREYYESLRDIYNKNLVGDDEPYRQTEVLKEVLVHVIKNTGDRMSLETIYFIADDLNIIYDVGDTKKTILEKCLIFLKGGINNG